MRRRRCLRAVAAVAGAILCATVFAVATASSARADADPAAVLPGPWVRAGRPVVVRVPGASRVRAASGPWALAQGAASDEFVLQVLRADLGTLELEVEDLTGGVRRVSLRAEPLPAAGQVRGVLGGAAGGPADVVVDLSSPATLPTVPEAWLVFDDVAEDPAAAAIPGLARAALDAWRRDLRATATPGFEPLRLAPDEHAFRAAAEAAAAAPRLPRDVSVALVVAAGATLLLLLVVRGARSGGDGQRTATVPSDAAAPVTADGPACLRRILWICAPSAACLAWFAVATPLPGAVRATSFVLEGDSGATAFVRFETDTVAEVAFAIPDGGSSAAVLAWDEGDATVREAEAGRRVRIGLPPGAVRIVAWRLPLAGDADGDAGAQSAGGDVPGGETVRWLRRLGLEPVQAMPGGPGSGGGTTPSGRVVLRGARGFRLIPAGAIRVATRK